MKFCELGIIGGLAIFVLGLVVAKNYKNAGLIIAGLGGLVTILNVVSCGIS